MNGTSVPSYSVNNPLTGSASTPYSTGTSYSTGMPSVPTYNGQTGAPSSPTNKGPLANKYPQPNTGYTGTSTSAYGVNTYNPMDYNTQHPTHQPTQPYDFR